MLKAIGAGFAGLVLAFLVVGLVEWLNSLAFPMPPGLNPMEPEAMALFMKTLPTRAFAVVVGGWTLAGCLGCALTRWLYPPRSLPAYAVQGLFVLACLANLWMLPHPTWMWVATLVAVPLACTLGLAGVEQLRGGQAKPQLP